MGNKISCAAHGCDILVDDQTVMSLLADHKVKTKYQHLITNSFVEVSSRTLCHDCDSNGSDSVQSSTSMVSEAGVQSRRQG